MLVPLGFLDEASVHEIAALSIEDLTDLSARLKEALETQERRKKILNSALSLKFGEAAQQLLKEKNMDSGTVKFKKEDSTVTAIFKKKVEWDQEKLRELFKRYPDSIKCRYSVDEKTYSALSDEQKLEFNEARTIKMATCEFLIGGNE